MQNAYMIRSDGKEFPVTIHLYGAMDDPEETLYAAEWLYNHTQFQSVKDLIVKLVAAYAADLDPQIREDNLKMRQMIESVKDQQAELQMKAERAFLVALNGDCHLPIGAYCDIGRNGRLTLHGVYGDASGERLAMASVMGNCCEAEALGRRLAEQLKGEVEG